MLERLRAAKETNVTYRIRAAKGKYVLRTHATLIWLSCAVRKVKW